jgi:NitT/TauT family transport system permease protein
VPRTSADRHRRLGLGRRERIAMLSLAVVLVVWEILGRRQPLFASYPTEIAVATTRVLFRDVVPAFGSTIVGYAAGLAISIPFAIVIGFGMGRVKLVDIILSPYVNALYVTPRIALIPLLVLWFGLDFKLRLAIVVLSAIFPMIVNVYAGTRNVDRALLEVARMFVASGRQRLLTIVLPSSLPYVFTGLRLGIARALGGVIVAEMTASITGIGRKLLDYGKFFLVDQLFVGIICIGIFGLLMTAGLRWVQRRTAPWTETASAR